MKRKRGKDEWFPIGGVFSGPSGPEQELQKVSPTQLTTSPASTRWTSWLTPAKTIPTWVHGAADDAVQPAAH